MLSLFLGVSYDARIRPHVYLWPSSLGYLMDLSGRVAGLRYDIPLWMPLPLLVLPTAWWLWSRSASAIAPGALSAVRLRPYRQRERPMPGARAAGRAGGAERHLPGVPPGGRSRPGLDLLCYAASDG